MKKFVYLIAEGVLDVVVLTQILRSEFKFDEVKRKADLPEEASKWLSQFKWPEGDDIKRRTVPAPAFLIDERFCVAIRNSQGITNIRRTMISDHEAFLRLDLNPSAVGIVLDSDDVPPADRFNEFAELLEERGLFAASGFGNNHFNGWTARRRFCISRTRCRGNT